MLKTLFVKEIYIKTFMSMFNNDVLYDVYVSHDTVLYFQFLYSYNYSRMITLISL